MSAVVATATTARPQGASFWGSVAVGWLLAKRDLLADLRTSKLALVWPLVYPLGYTSLFVLLKPVVTAGAPESILPYGLYVFVGFASWQVWFEAMRTQMDGVRRHSALLACADLNPASVFAAGVFLAWYQTALRVFPAIIVALVVGTPSWEGVALFVLGSAMIPVNGAVVGLLLQPLATLYKDVGRVVQSISLALLFSAGVFISFPADLSPTTLSLLSLNPLGPLLAGARGALLEQVNVFGEATYVWMGLTVALATLLLAVAKRVLPVLLERIGS